MSMSDRFPLNYFKSIWTPKQVYVGRRNLNWFQLIFILLFLNALLVIPVTLHYTKMDDLLIDGTFPNAFSLIDESVVAELKDEQFVNGTMEVKEPFYIEKDQGVIGAGLEEGEVEKALEKENALLFLEKELLLKEGDHPVSEVPFTKDFDLSQIETVDDLKEEISRQWFVHNKSFVVGSFSFIIFTILLVSLLAIVLGASLFIYLARRSRLINIRSFKESVNLIVNCTSLGSIIAMIGGLIYFDIVVMIMIQSIGLVCMLLAVFFKSAKYETEQAKD